MNRIVAAGLLLELAEGKRTLYFGSNVEIALNAMDVLIRTAADFDMPIKAIRTHGNQRINYKNGGWIVFKTIRTSRMNCRGFSADIAYIDDPDWVATEDHFSAIHYALASRDGEMIRG